MTSVAASTARTSEQALLRIIGLIYESALSPAVWNQVVEHLSLAMAGATVSLRLNLPGHLEPPQHYMVGLDPDMQWLFDEHFKKGLPWSSQMRGAAYEGFVLLDEFLADEELPETDFYREWMQPQGLAPRSPLVHVFAAQNKTALAGIAIHQLAGRRPFEKREHEFLNRLVLHFSRSYKIHDRLRSLARHHDVLSEVMDRLPTGILLIDSTGQVLATNRAAELTMEHRRGLQIRDGRPVANKPSENTALQRLIRRAIDSQASREIDPTRAMTIARAGARDGAEARLPLLVTPLLEPLIDGLTPSGVAVIFVGDPDIMRIGAVNVLRSLYGLTEAEGELMRLISQGLSLDQAAARRNVKLTTIRTQLKRVFAKTGAKRQSDLVRMVLNGISSLHEK